MSRRRGKVSSDPDLIERRNWYASVELENRQKGEEAEFESGIGTQIDHDISQELAARSEAISGNAAVAAFTNPELARTTNAIQSNDAQEKKDSGSPPRKPMQFSSLALDLFDEFSVHTSSYTEDKPKPIKYVKDPNLVASKWLIPESNASEEIPFQSETVLVCFHGIGESPAKYLRWGSFFRERGLDVELWCTCLPGRMLRTTEPCASTIVQASGSIVDSMVEIGIVQKPNKKSKQRIRNLFLFGHSIGSLIAFESARSLIKLGIPVNHLIVSAETAPHLLSQTNVDRFRTKMSTRPFKELLERMISMNGRPNILKERKDLLTIFIPILKSDYQLREDYLYYTDAELQGDDDSTTLDDKSLANENACFSIPITSIGTVDDPICPENELLDWSSLTTGRHYYFTFPADMGGHAYLSLADIPSNDISSYSRPMTSASSSIGGGGGGGGGGGSVVSVISESKESSLYSSKTTTTNKSNKMPVVGGGGSSSSVVSELGSTSKLPTGNESAIPGQTSSLAAINSALDDEDDVNFEEDVLRYASYFTREVPAAVTAIQLVGIILEPQHNNLRALMEAFSKSMRTEEE